MPSEIQFGLRWRNGNQTGGEDLFQRFLTRFNGDLHDWSPAFQVIAEGILAPLVEGQFESGGAEGGTSWAELAPSTLKHRRTATILRGTTGRLAQSFVAMGGDHIEAITPTKLAWGSAVPYSLYHQTGTGKGYQQTLIATGTGTGRGMPMRKILVMTPQMKVSLERAFLDQGDQIARSAGFGVSRQGMGRLTQPDARGVGNIVLGTP